MVSYASSALFWCYFGRPRAATIGTWSAEINNFNCLCLNGWVLVSPNCMHTIAADSVCEPPISTSHKYLSLNQFIRSPNLETYLYLSFASNAIPLTRLPDPGSGLINYHQPHRHPPFFHIDINSQYLHSPLMDPAANLSPADDAEISDLLSNLVTRIHGVIARYVAPSTFAPPDVQPVVIASWMKSGTTLTQQLVYQLLVATGSVPTDPTGTDFDDISAVVPFIEMSQLGPSTSVHPYRPTAWKTHSSPAEFLTPAYAHARFLVAVRDGRSVMRSFADFAVEWVGGRTVPSHLRPAFYELFFRMFFLGASDVGRGAVNPNTSVQWFENVRAWRDEKQLRGRVLFLVYEDVVKDMSRTVRDVARFIGVQTDDAAVTEVVKKCSRENMAGDPKFRDRLVAKAMGFSESGGLRVRKEGQSGGYKHVVSERSSIDYDRMFETTFGVNSYEELCEQLRERNREVLPWCGGRFQG